MIVVVCLGILALWLLYKKLKRNHAVKRRHEAEEVYDDSSESVYQNDYVNYDAARGLCFVTDYSNCVFYECYCESSEAESVLTFEGPTKIPVK